MAERRTKLMMLRRVIEGFGIVILAVMYLVSPACTTARTVKSSTTAPDFALNNSEGVPIRLSDYKGRVVLLNFWATWCHGCVLEIPWFIEFQERYKDSGLSVIGVSMDEDWKPVKAFVEEKKVNYSIVIGNEALGKLYELNAMPMTWLIDRSGKIAASYTGVVDMGACESELRTLVQKNVQKAAR
jgi:peroxiredoxin